METLKLATILIMLVLVPAVHPKSLFRRIREIKLHLVKETTPSASLNDSETTVAVTTHHTTLAPVTAAALHDHRTNETEPVAQADATATAPAALYHHQPDHHQTDNSTDVAQNVTKQPLEAAGQTSATANTSELPKGVTMKTLQKAEDETKSAVVVKSTPPPKPEDVSTQAATAAAKVSTSVAGN